MSVHTFKHEIAIEKIVGEEKFELFFVLDIKHTVEYDIPPSGDIIAGSRFSVVNWAYRGSDRFKNQIDGQPLEKYPSKRYYLAHFVRRGEPPEDLSEKASANVDRCKLEITKEIKQMFLL